jgi:hypothetical protein
MGEPRDPFRVFLFLLAFFNGLAFIFTAPPSTAIEATFDHVFIVGYGVLLTLGSGFVLTGMFWQGFARDGLLIKRVGFLALAFATAIYTGAVVVSAPGKPGVALAASVAGAFAGICAWQVRRINKRVKYLMSQSPG